MKNIKNLKNSLKKSEANTMKARIKSIEFIGLPGSGKTYFYNQLRRILFNNGIETCSFRDLYLDLEEHHKVSKESIIKYLTRYHFYRFIIRNKLYFLKVLKLICYLPGSSVATKLRILRFFIREGAACSFYKKFHSDKIMISDEGFLHRVLTYGFSRALSTDTINSYLKYCPISDIIVVLTHSPKDVSTRREFKTEPFCEIFNIQTEIERKNEILMMDNNFRKLLLILEDKNVPIIEISPYDTIDSLLQKILCL